MESNSTGSLNTGGSDKKDSNQPDHSECLKLLHLVLDDEATAEQKDYFDKHVCNCMPYYEIYHVDKAIKSLVKNTCCGKNVPADLADAIKEQIFRGTDKA
ncbi:anti-sigma factor [Fulvivirga lutimaris]|uniref:anti-sigma factor n=1 Tax=Fulvivirga lutimaris TaxID=1819566 RepID=UPI0012BC1F86|nr:anti-sigma factor [Fulvivirga lutimaris]MTI38754.1 anti-sigma factor [Fulvivirga lutimaris]